VVNAKPLNAAEPADIEEIDEDQEGAVLEEEEPEPETSELPAPSRVHAVWCITLNMGSCNGCDQQIQALLAPRYRLARRGITFANSPRHADIILLTGVLTRRTLDPVRRVLAQVPDPHAVIAVGDCVIDGNVFAGSPDLIPDAADLLGVNVEIAGNPPTPAQIVRAIEAAAHLLDEADASGAADEEAEAEEAEIEDEPEAEGAEEEEDGEEAYPEEEDAVDEDAVMDDEDEEEDEGKAKP
jgi:membrane-bound hydrogenase subunit mbhJ